MEPATGLDEELRVIPKQHHPFYREGRRLFCSLPASEAEGMIAFMYWNPATRQLVRDTWWKGYAMGVGVSLILYLLFLGWR